MKINNRYQILTPNGYEDFDGIQKVKRDKFCKVVFKDNTEIECSTDHVFLSGKEEFKAKDLQKDDCISSKNGYKIVKSIELVDESIELYDLINAGKDHVYYTNDILSHNCCFDGSNNTLLHGDVLDKLIPIDPIDIKEIYKSDYKLKIYHQPKENCKYIITIDPSEGLGLDYTGIHVWDISKKNKRIQCAVMYNNKISIPEAPFVISAIGKFYNNALILIENNKFETIVRDIFEKTEYYGDIFLNNDGRYGIRTTQHTRNISLKQMEHEFSKSRFEINDYDTIHELNCFIEHNGKFQADQDNHDDLVMSLSLLCYIIADSVLYEQYITENEQYMKDVHDIDESQLDFLIDDGANVIRLNDKRNIYDELDYDDDWF